MGTKARPHEKLAAYRAKRDFAVTSEPAGGTDGGEPAGRFVVQRHRARRLHYDFRLEVDGVLASWAVPKGPTLDPKVKRLAVHVEDHPIEYRDFEGVIPGGEYGGGDVIVWDRGTWTAHKTDDPAEAIERGELHFAVRGEKLAGHFMLIRRGHDGESWLLFHKDDEDAVAGWDPEEHPLSVKSGRTNDEVAAAPEALWRADLPAAEAEVAVGAAGHWPPPAEDELAALDALGKGGRWSLGGRELRLTNLDKVLFPKTKDRPEVTKRDLIRYHATVAPHMLPYLAGRPVNLHRFPNGVERKGFWQKEVGGTAPDWLTTWHNPEAKPDRSETYAVLDSPAALAWAANHAAVELHPWTSGLRDVHQPDWALIDVDPGEDTTFAEVVLLARLYGEALGHLGVEGMPKVTGQRGVQIWVPVRAGYTYEETREWVRKVSKAVGRTVPELVSWEWYRDRRGGLARLDYTQNVRNKTLVAPFSARPAPGAPVSVPITWEELADPELRPDRWTVHTVLDRLAETGDPLHPLIGRAQELPTL
ncbi:non-homologous end-joining DNA ligase LigD [Phytomonospora endophytica]|uniref:Bifunctional non-homologous end joining protein LigD n=1 Tax=Phytomonospora endophytica TaxID=714109 RepID=A0A841FM87_9ACTN|nr:DNA polymerase ligase N-terminal domain-containing protein [Phytomonospora endophytica]MBB6036974.1 bifunctional non-homologous end joining protein LigD [Phytomonospora endophytica]GIG67995.1 ATP-dependent DNA ligase [Phytomonospora endophytica]